MAQPSMRQPVPVGKYFLDRGKITAVQLELALKHRAEFGLKLGQSMVELGLVTEADMVDALRHQARFPCIHLTMGIVDARIAAKVGAELSRRLRVVALNQIAGHTTVAMEDPSDTEALEELAHILATRIFPVYAEPTAIRKCVERVFGSDKRTAPQTKKAHPRPPAGSTTGQEAKRPETAGDSGAGAGVEAAPSPDERAVVDRVRAILHEAFEEGVTHIHLEPHQSSLVVRFRSDGLLREHSSLPGAWTRPAIACLKALAKIETGEVVAASHGSIPLLFKKQPIEVMIATTPSLHGESAVLGIRRSEPSRNLAHLGMDDDQLASLEALLTQPGGLVLVAGPAGSGCSTTLRTLLARVAAPDKKVVSLAPHGGSDLAGVLHIQVGPGTGVDYASATRDSLRQDPDFLFVHDGGTEATARGLLAAALAGCGVFATLRTSGALDSLSRLVALGLEPYLLADSLRAVVAQRLVRRICADCRTPIVPDEVLRVRLGLPKDGATYHEGEGCAACNGTGFRGRLALFEVLTLTSGLRRELEKGASSEALADAASAQGFLGLRAHGLRQARAGQTTLHEVLKATTGA